ncbi:TetR family transcriptional regulator [Streptomyces sp. NPDC051218]|uniref:TetR family transcriptional regulator n=1 Tax=Streptomyces sp. NPDC051218 TaxID=3365645 RepID=UPI0037924955
MAQQARAQRTRKALIESAAEMFDRHGFALASLSTISAHAGVSKGAMHFHFANKESLAEAVGAAAAQRLARITDRRRGHLPGGALQLLIDATHDLARGLGEDAVLRVGLGAGHAPGHYGACGGDPRGLWTAWVGEVLRRAAGEGAMTRSAPADAVTATLVATTLGLGTLTSPPDPAAPAPRTDATVTTLWNLLLPRLATTGAAGELVPSGTPGRGGPPGASE